MFQHALERGTNRVGWNRKADSLRTATTGNDLFVNADNFPSQVDQWPAAVPWIDCGVGLEQITTKIRAVRSSFPANNSIRHGLLEPKRIADRQNKIARLHRVGISKFQRLDARVIDFEHRHIQLGISADQSGLFGAAIAQLHLNLVHLINDVIVGDNVTFIGNNHAGAQRVLHQRLVSWIAKSPLLITEKKLEWIKTIFAANADFFGRFHRNNRRKHAADKRAPLPIQRLQRCDLLGVHTRLRGERILFGFSDRRQI